MERKRTLQPENRSLSYFTVSFNTLMFGTVKKGFGKLVAWLDWPPPKPRAGLNDVHWEFLGDLLGELTATTDRETACLMRMNLSDPDNVRALAECWIRPAWQRLTPSSREKIRHTLDFYLTGDSGKIDRVLPSFQIPVNVRSARHFFGVIRETLFGAPSPVTIDPARYRENNHQSFVNSLYTDWNAKSDPKDRHADLPVRKGLILPAELERHAAIVPLRQLQRWVATGVRPDGTAGLPCDAGRWCENTDVDTVRHIACARFLRGQESRLNVYRLTLAFSHPVGEGYLAHRPHTLVVTRKVRYLFDRLGFLVRCYPMLRE